MNRFQFLYLTTFFGVFASLVLITNYLGAKLRAAGYDVSRIILIGLPTNNSEESTAPAATKFTVPWGFNTTMSTQFDLKDLQDKGYLQVAAVVLALLSSVFFYVKFGSASESNQCAIHVTWL